MSGAVDRFVRLLQLPSELSSRRRIHQVREHERRLADVSDAELVALGRKLTSSPKLGHVGRPGARDWRSVVASTITSRDVEALGLAAAAFSRFPPGALPRGIRLYDEQLVTAIQLLRGAIVQMDTGEGKTFAIAAAAFALLRIHPKVYVVTANPYLAGRDAAQTAPFWHGLGVNVARALPRDYRDHDPRAWQAQVIYTTLSALAIRSLDEDLGDEHTLAWSAALLDEADAVLLEQSTEPESIGVSTDPATKDWSRALELASRLTTSDVTVTQSLHPSAQLNAQGEKVVLAGLEDDETLSPTRRLLLLHDVELAYVALNLAIEGHHYEFEDRRVVALDPASGWRTRGRPAWFPALEHAHGLTSPRRVARHRVDGLTLFRRFDHIAGASGTVVHEALDYLLLLDLPPAIVRPRVARQNGRLPDLIGASREIVYDWIVDEVKKHGAHRPVLIATESTHEAEQLADRLRAEVSPQVTVRAVSGETIAEERLFESAGRPGMTIVSTRVAGRGVDIVLTDEARRNGGTMLIAVGHALEPRIDRQLLGRVGRSGDPYTATFVSHPDDPFTRTIVNPKMLERAAGIADEPVPARIYNRQTARAQLRYRLSRLSQFAGGVVRGQSEGAAYDMLHQWRQALGRRDGEALPERFVTFLVERLIATNYAGLAGGQELEFREPETVVTDLTRLLDRPVEDTRRLTVDTSLKDVPEARRILIEFASDALREADRANSDARRRIAEESAAQERALLDIRMLRAIREMVRDDGERGDAMPHALAAALGAGGGQSAPRVSDEAIEARQIQLRSELELTREGQGELPILDGSANGAAAEHAAEVALSLLARDDEPDPRELRALADHVDRAIDDRLEAAASFDERWPAFVWRSSWDIASESIGGVTIRLIEGLSKISFQLSNTNDSVRYSAMYAKAVDELRRNLEAELAADLCTDLIAGRDPRDLDDLFAVRERAVYIPQRPPERLALPPLPRSYQAPEPPTAPPAAGASHIYDYVAAVQERMGKGAPPRERLYAVLNSFEEIASSVVLSDTDRVATTYTTWKKSSAARKKIAPWQRSKFDRHVKGYIAFLAARGLSAPLPSGVVATSQSLARRSRAAFSDKRFVLGATFILPALALSAILLLVPRAPETDVSPAVGYLDRLVTGGALSAGSFVGPVLLALVGCVYLRLLLGDTSPGGIGGQPLERTFGLVLLAGGTLALLGRGDDGPWDILATVPAFAALMLVGLVIRNSSWQFERLTHSRFSAGLAGALAVLSIPFLVDLEGSTALWPIAGVTVVVLAATHHFRKVHIHVRAMRVDSDLPEGGEISSVALPVRAPVSVVPHAFALIFAWAVACALLDLEPTATTVVAAATYVVILGMWARVLAGSATDEARWQKSMRSREQEYLGSDARPKLQAGLVWARRRLVVLELGTAVPLVAFATVAALDAPAAVVDDLPVGLAALCAAAIAFELLRLFGQSLAEPLTSATAATTLAAERDEIDLGELFGDSVRRLTRKLGIIAAVILALGWIASARDIWELVVDIVDWVMDALG